MKGGNVVDMNLRIELFAADPVRSADFYTGDLGFIEERRNEVAGSGVYVALRRDQVRIGIAPAGRSVPAQWRDVPAGTEIVLEVADLESELNRVRAAGWPLHRGLERQEWGLSDFRLLDPDGYYLRVTSLD